jgi:predicted MFS family arabinose efflux permease
MIAIVYLIFAYLTTFTLIAASILVFGACWGIRAVTEWAFLTSIVKPELKTLAIGYMESFWDVGGSLGNFLAGMLAGVLPYQLIFLLLALINLPTLPAILKLKEANKN